MNLLGALAAVLVSITPPPPLDDAPPPMPSTGVVTAGDLQTRTLETPRFLIRYTARAEGAAHVLARDIEGMRDEVATLLGRDWPGVTELRVGFGREEYEGLALPGGAPPSWAVALAYPAQNVMLIEAHSLVNGEGATTLKHELVHVALGRFGSVWPHWFQEGLAQELTGERRWRMEHYATLTRAVTQDRIFDFDDLTSRFPALPDDVEIAYAQSVAFLEFLRDRHGSSAFQRLIDRVQGGDGFEKAFGVAFGVSLPMEERAFREDLPRKYPWWPLLLSGGTLVWALTSILLPVAFLRRRREVKRLRAEQLRLEALHEAAQHLVTVGAANDDQSGELLWEFPWVVHVVLFPEAGAQASSSTTQRKADG